MINILIQGRQQHQVKALFSPASLPSSTMCERCFGIFNLFAGRIKLKFRLVEVVFAPALAVVVVFAAAAIARFLQVLRFLAILRKLVVPGKVGIGNMSELRQNGSERGKAFDLQMNYEIARRAISIFLYFLYYLKMVDI